MKAHQWRPVATMSEALNFAGLFQHWPRAHRHCNGQPWYGNTFAVIAVESIRGSFAAEDARPMMASLVEAALESEPAKKGRNRMCFEYPCVLFGKRGYQRKAVAEVEKIFGPVVWRIEKEDASAVAFVRSCAVAIVAPVRGDWL